MEFTEKESERGVYAHTCPNSYTLNVQLSEDGKSLAKTLVLYIGYTNTYPMG